MEHVHLHVCRKCGKDLGKDAEEYFCEGCFPAKAPHHEHHQKIKILDVGGESPNTAARMEHEKETAELEAEKKRIIEKLSHHHTPGSEFVHDSKPQSIKVNPEDFVHGQCRVCGKPTAIDSHVFCEEHVRVPHFAEPQQKIHVLGVYNVESPSTSHKPE